MKIRIFQPIVPEYRKALFEGVGLRYGENVEIWAAEGSGQDKSYALEHMRYDYAHPFRRIGPLVWQCGLSLNGLAKGDVIVVCGDIHQLSSLWIAAKARLRGIKVVWWGHHKTATSKAAGVRIRLAIAKPLSDVFLCYTRTGIKYLETHGFRQGRVFATGNTIDQAPIKAAIEYWKGRHDIPSLPSPYILCCGVMREKIHLELLLQALTNERLCEVNLVVIGDGPMKETWQGLSKKLGVTERVIWIPGTRDQMVMAPWFVNAQAFVYPGSIGLSILHSFSYALPVITHDNTEHQMPEFEVMEDGKTGICFKEGSLDGLTSAIVTCLADGERRKRMAEYCQKLAYEKYSMNQMVANYCNAIEAAVAL